MPRRAWEVLTDYRLRAARAAARLRWRNAPPLASLMQMARGNRRTRTGSRRPGFRSRRRRFGRRTAGRQGYMAMAWRNPRSRRNPVRYRSVPLSGR